MPVEWSRFTAAGDTAHEIRTIAGWEVLVLTDPLAVIQATGWLRLESAAPVYMRGQSSLWDSVVPSLYRHDGKGDPPKEVLIWAKRRVTIAHHYEELAQERRLITPATSPQLTGAVMQHYFVRSGWIDLVDNVWVALWFSCHAVRAMGKLGARPLLRHAPKPSIHTGVDADDDDLGFILVHSPGSGAWTDAGIYAGDSHHVELIDLRATLPSTYVRPHAQHGAVLRRSSIRALDDIDLADTVIGVVAVPRSLALNWLGDSQVLRSPFFFPPPTFDFGYQRLLNRIEAVEEAFTYTNVIGRMPLVLDGDPGPAT